MLWFSVACFWCQRFGDVFNLMCVPIILVRFWVAEWPPFRKELLSSSVVHMFS